MNPKETIRTHTQTKNVKNQRLLFSWLEEWGFLNATEQEECAGKGKREENRLSRQADEREF